MVGFDASSSRAIAGAADVHAATIARVRKVFIGNFLKHPTARQARVKAGPRTCERGPAPFKGFREEAPTGQMLLGGRSTPSLRCEGGAASGSESRWPMNAIGAGTPVATCRRGGIEQWAAQYAHVLSDGVLGAPERSPSW